MDSAAIHAVNLLPFVELLQAPLVDGGMGLSPHEAKAATRELVRFLALKARARASPGSTQPSRSVAWRMP